MVGFDGIHLFDLLLNEISSTTALQLLQHLIQLQLTALDLLTNLLDGQLLRTPNKSMARDVISLSTRTRRTRGLFTEF